MKQRLKKVFSVTWPRLGRGADVFLLSLARWRLLPVYQPLLARGGEWDDPDGRALTDERWRAVASRLNGAGSVLDVGCNSGYFTLNAAGTGAFCLGIEKDPVYLALARAQASELGLTRAIFAGIELDSGAVSKLPAFDAVFCLSVYHHWVRYFGRAEADAIMKGLAGKCANRLFFETGQVDEVASKWSDLLAFMGSDAEAWIREFLRGLGFRSVEKIGSFPTTVSREPRHLFVAEK